MVVSKPLTLHHRIQETANVLYLRDILFRYTTCETFFSYFLLFPPVDGQKSGCVHPGPFLFPAQQGSLPHGGPGTLIPLELGVKYKMGYHVLRRDGGVGGGMFYTSSQGLLSWQRCAFIGITAICCNHLKAYPLLPWLPPCPLPLFPLPFSLGRL